MEHSNKSIANQVFIGVCLANLTSFMTKVVLKVIFERTNAQERVRKLQDKYES